MGDESDSDSFLRPKRKRKVRYVIEDDDDDGSSNSDSSIEITWHTKRIKAGKKNCIRDSDESDSDSSIEVIRRKKRIGVSYRFFCFVVVCTSCSFVCWLVALFSNNEATITHSKFVLPSGMCSSSNAPRLVQAGAGICRVVCADESRDGNCFFFVT